MMMMMPSISPVASLPAVPKSVQGASSVVGLACQGALGSQIPGGEKRNIIGSRQQLVGHLTILD